MSKLSYLHTTEYYAGMKKEDVLYILIWTPFQVMYLSEKRQDEKQYKVVVVFFVYKMRG